MMNAKINYKIYGEDRVDILIEMGLGACLGEWMHLAEALSVNHGVLLYERAGINHSGVCDRDRTPLHIAQDLYELLEAIPHADKVILIAHSQGGLYAQQFARLYPELMKGILLLDPLSAKDNKFKELLTEQEYKKSGVDKSANLLIMHKLAKLHMGFLTKKLMKKAPPFYYYDNFSEEAGKDILNAVTNPIHCLTAWKEYVEAHKNSNIEHLKEKGDFPDIPLVLITHSSHTAIDENMKFGNNSREFAEKVEEIWQNLMKEYLTFSSNSIWLQARNSSHFIHLTESQLLFNGIEWIETQSSGL
jgi:pimeloyl-ACP methyl ester carboxylesterase